MQGVLDLALHGLTDRMTGVRGEPAGLGGQGTDECVLLPAQFAQLRAVEVLVGLAQALPQPEQGLDLAGSAADQEVADPGGEAGLAQGADPLGELLVAGGAGGCHGRGAGGGEVLRAQGVQLVHHGVVVHERPFRVEAPFRSSQAGRPGARGAGPGPAVGPSPAVGPRS
ncbi:hypothetical protein [Streptomyces viridochromogenes]|uniref:hypothetical protein n=1 Tax=Streptomyces viridochromogenes TaxID=1938 RepID=UPI001FCC0C12|nr:hypothetical protein [Streptomyces viridochromogenes]